MKMAVCLLLLCPEQKITSPKTTFMSVIVDMVGADTETLRPVVSALCAGRVVFHSPDGADEVAWVDAPAKVTVTLVPTGAHPQIGAGRSRCRTMFEPKTFDSSSDTGGGAP